MIRTIITPENTDVHISIPQNYVGKKIEVLLFASDEPEDEKNPQRKSVASLRGSVKMTSEQYDDLTHHLKKVREEWE